MKPDYGTKIKLDNRSLFEQLFQTYYSSLCRFVWRMSGDLSTSEDVVQEVFIKLWERQELLQSLTNPKAFLYRSVYNHFISTHRKSLKNTVDVWSLLDESPAENIIENTLFAQETAHFVDQAMLRLSEATRLVFTLSREEGLSYIDIAKTLDISVSSVEKHIMKALKALKMLNL
jgi:RNA polymerase sigma-70 factor (ECF subfamily)